MHEKTERNLQMLEAYKNGASSNEIGKRYSLSGSFVRRVLRRYKTKRLILANDLKGQSQ